MCVMNIYRARYATELVDLHFSLEALSYIFLLVIIQLPTNFLTYAYITRFKGPDQPLPVSFMLKPLSTLLGWTSFMITSIPKMPRYIMLLKNCCFRIHTTAVMIPAFVVPPITAVVQEYFFEKFILYYKISLYKS